jgi:hypothetical protein
MQAELWLHFEADLDVLMGSAGVVASCFIF